MPVILARTKTNEQMQLTGCIPYRAMTGRNQTLERWLPFRVIHRLRHSGTMHADRVLRLRPAGEPLNFPINNIPCFPTALALPLPSLFSAINRYQGCDSWIA